MPGDRGLPDQIPTCLHKRPCGLLAREGGCCRPPEDVRPAETSVFPPTRTERSAFGIITDLVEAGYVVKEKDGRRNRYHIQAHLPLPEPTARERTVGDVLVLLTGTDAAVTGKSAATADSP
jgi:hypothetical protein